MDAVLLCKTCTDELLVGDASVQVVIKRWQKMEELVVGQVEFVALKCGSQLGRWDDTISISVHGLRRKRWFLSTLVFMPKRVFHVLLTYSIFCSLDETHDLIPRNKSNSFPTGWNKKAFYAKRPFLGEQWFPAGACVSLPWMHDGVPSSLEADVNEVIRSPGRSSLPQKKPTREKKERRNTQAWELLLMWL